MLYRSSANSAGCTVSRARARQATAELCSLKARQAAAQPQAAAAPCARQTEDGVRRRYSLEFLKQQGTVHKEKPVDLPDGIWINNTNSMATFRTGNNQAGEPPASTGSGVDRWGKVVWITS